jgi:hypothetical protein
MDPNREVPYKNVLERSIREMLGEWWRTLDAVEWSCCDADEAAKGSSNTRQSKVSYQLTN